MRIECLCFVKSGSAPVPGAVVSVSSPRGVVHRTADFNGRCVFKDLPEGAYKIKQVSAPSRFLKSQTVHSVTLNKKRGGAVLGFANSPKSAPKPK